MDTQFLECREIGALFGRSTGHFLDDESSGHTAAASGKEPRLWISPEGDVSVYLGFEGLEAVGDDAGEDVDEGIDW